MGLMDSWINCQDFGVSWVEGLVLVLVQVQVQVQELQQP
jgi:hypothetical protein